METYFFKYNGKPKPQLTRGAEKVYIRNKENKAIK